MKKFLKELAQSNKVLIAGSFVRGEQTEDSDIDFFIKTPRHCIIYGDRNENIDFIIALLKKHEINWNSTRTSYISTIGSKNDLPIEMEFYDNFPRNKNRLLEVEIMGVKFKTI